MRYRCDWCGRFYAAELPSACPRHTYEHSERLLRSIREHNARLNTMVVQLPPPAWPACPPSREG